MTSPMYYLEERALEGAVVRDVGVGSGELSHHLDCHGAVFFELTKHATWPQLLQWSYEPALLNTAIRRSATISASSIRSVSIARS